MYVYCTRCWTVHAPSASHCRTCGAPLVAEGDYVARLIQALEHPEPQTPVRAATILGQRRERRAVDPLIHAVTRQADPYVAAAAARALGEIGDPRAVPALVAALRSGPVPVRLAAAQALGALGNAAARAALREAAETDASPRVRHQAATALRRASAPSRGGDGA